MRDSAWTHALCNGCWNELNPDKPAEGYYGPPEQCCKCGALTRSGIYYRAPREEMPHCPGR